MAIRKPSNEIGRGNQDPTTSVHIPGIGVSAIIGITDSAAIETDAEIVLTFPQPGGGTITIGIGAFSNSGTSDIEVLNGARTGIGSAQNMASAINSSSFGLTATDRAVTGGAVVDITNDSGGIAGVVTRAVTGTVTSFTINSQTVGVNPSSIEEPVFNFNGPFTNIAPNKAPIQGMARVAMAWHDWLLAINAATTGAGLLAANIALRTSLAALVPTNAGIPARTGSALRKIAIRGSRRDSNGMVGRGKNDLSFVFINETADYSLRQLVVRIFDAVQDVVAFIVDVSPGLDGTNFTNLKTLLGEVLREFSIEIGELERAIGRAGTLYENTIVNNSSDQGLLLYSDELADAADVLTDTPTPDINGWGVDVESAFPVSRRNRVLLKN